MSGPMINMIQFLENTLSKCGCEKYLHLFLEHAIDEESYKSLQRDNLLRMDKNMKEGDLIRILKSVEECRKANQNKRRPVANPFAAAISQSTGSAIIRPGAVYRILSSVDGNCLQKGGTYKNKDGNTLTSIVTCPYLAKSNQIWKTHSQGVGFRFELIESPGSALHNDWFENAALYPHDGQGYQNWKCVAVGGGEYEIHNMFTAPGNDITLLAYSGSNKQVKLVKQCAKYAHGSAVKWRFLEVNLRYVVLKK